MYEFQLRGGPVYRCIWCIAVERGQDQLRKPFDVFVDFGPGVVVETEEEAREMAKSSYNDARGWFQILSRLVDDDPIIKPDPEAIGTVPENIRTFLTNVMGSDAHKRPSELLSGEDRRNIRSVNTDTEHSDDDLVTDGGGARNGVDRSDLLGQIEAAQLHRRDGNIDLARRALMDAKSRALRHGYDDLAQYATDELSKTMQETAR